MKKMKSRPHITVTELLRFSVTDIQNKLKTDLLVRFEDDVDMEMSYKEVILLRYLLDIYNTPYPVKIKSTHCFKNYYSNGLLNSTSIQKGLSCLIRDVVNDYIHEKKLPRKILEHYCYNMFQCYNNIYNNLIYNCLEYTSSINVVELLDIQYHPDLISSIVDVYKSKKLDTILKEENIDNRNFRIGVNTELLSYKINKTYQVLDRILRNDYKDTSIGKNYIAGAINPAQVCQVLASRGHISNMDNQIYSIPIASSFTLGMLDMYELSIEAVTAMKSLYLANKGVSASVYMSRELELNTMIIERLVDGDCGSKSYLYWAIKPTDKLKNLIGKYYYNEKTGKEEVITANDTHLLGTVVPLRSVLTCCLPNHNEVCTRCFGELSYSIPTHANIGHFASSSLTEVISQSILSYKHLAKTANNESEGHIGIYREISKNGLVYLTREVANPSKDFRILIEYKTITSIRSMVKEDTILKNQLQRLSSVKHFYLISNEMKKPIEINIQMENNSIGCYTEEFIRYMLTTDYEVTDVGSRLYKLDKWDFNNPIIMLPNKEYSYLTLVNDIKAIIHSSDSTSKKSRIRVPDGSPVVTVLSKLFEVVNNRISCNIALLEIILYSLAVSDFENNDFNLTRNRFTDINSVVTKKSNTLLLARSLGIAYGWEKHLSTIFNPMSFLPKGKLPHPMDVMIKPEEVLKSGLFY